MIAKTMLTRTTNNTNHQYSDRAARPEKTKYFVRHVFIASTKLMFVHSLKTLPHMFCQEET
ncbi:hypothetical protein RUA8715_03510 [Ruegeria arenilitoris]|uniref:Uncharacterized protein n=1 Tax=Ruegeria arenilitoris TaxID=1173585 RepID=A0A238L0L6_9RHOB|nr:hypothetical protein RUA8715_03510 [Ruegeria arenilitoris]